MAHKATMTGTRDSFTEPSYSRTQLDPLRNYPIGDRNALRHYYLTKDVLINGTELGKTPRTANDLAFALQRDISRGQYSSGRSRPFDLVTMDWVNNRDTSAPAATSGRFAVSVDHAGAFIPVGTHSEGSASPSQVGFATEAAQQTGIVVVGLFRADGLDVDGIFRVYLTGTAATDHWGAEVRVTNMSVHAITRAASADTSDANATLPTGDIVASEVTYVSLGARVNADDTFIIVVNGEIQLSGTLSAGAAALTGNQVGVRLSGVAPGTGVLLFQAIDLKVRS